MAMETLRTNKMRSGLTVLGVVIGITSIVGMTSLIRGFDSSRVSLTFDGIPLNDSGNYAIYSNQQLDPELIEQVNVNLGTTDVDSPTASAVGGTVNYRSITPDKTMGGRVSISLGQFDFRRFFGLFQTGELTSWGTRAWLSASARASSSRFLRLSGSEGGRCASTKGVLLS